MSDYISPHFKWYDEVYCKCRQCVMPVKAKIRAVALAERLEALRVQYGPVRVNSWYRCPEHNTRVGGAERSQHLTGGAGDIVCPGYPGDLAEWADIHFPDGGVGDYKTFTHVDIRGRRARWTG